MNSFRYKRVFYSLFLFSKFIVLIALENTILNDKDDFQYCNYYYDDIKQHSINIMISFLFFLIDKDLLS